MAKAMMIAAMAGIMLAGCANQGDTNQNAKDMTKLQLSQEWDKVFTLSDSVNHRKVTFDTQYGLTLAADLYEPKQASSGKLPAIAVSGPFGATKEQSSGLYAMRMAERGFVALAFDPSFTGESSGEPRRTASPDINTEDFMAAVDFPSRQENVDPQRIGIIGICGWGGIALNAAAADTRIKATVASTMYDMTRVTTRPRATPAVRLWPSSVSPTPTRWPAVWWTRCPTTRRSLSKTITTITRPRAATTSAAATPTTDGE